MDKKSDLQTATSYTLDLHVKNEGIFYDIEMGVLENGVPFLTQTGLAQVCGIRRQTVADISSEYSSCFSGGVSPRGRMKFISSHLSENGFDENKLFIQILDKGVVKKCLSKYCLYGSSGVLLARNPMIIVSITFLLD